MILIENRELLIPNNERYIGTTQDALSENRTFRIRRINQAGVDMANLTFRLDIKYPEARKAYTFETSTSRTGRIARVNARLWTKKYCDAGTYVFAYNGTSWTYDGQSVSFAEIGVSVYFTPNSGDTVTVTAKVESAAGDSVVLDKEVTDDQIILTWQITDTVLSVPGACLISLRASDEVGAVRWASFYAMLYVEQNGYIPSDFTSGLSELEQLENDISQDIAIVEDLAQRSIAYGDEAEAWAVGTRNGVEVEEGDETYHNNAKYYAENAAKEIETASASTLEAAAASASAAATSESEARDAETMAKKYRDEAAEKIDDTTAATNTVYSSSKTEAVIAEQWTTVHTWTDEVTA